MRSFAANSHEYPPPYDGRRLVKSAFKSCEYI